MGRRRIEILALVLAGLLTAASGCTMGSEASDPAATTTSVPPSPGLLPIDLGTLGGDASSARGVNDAGQVVGSSETESGNPDRHAFLWDADNGMVDLGTLGGATSEAVAINDAGQVVGWSLDSSYVTRAFIWDEVNGMVDLGTPCCNSWAYGINDSGQVVGQAGSEPYGLGHAFLWSEADGMIDLGTLGGSTSEARAINEAGQVVGWADKDGDTQRHAFVWDEVNGMVDLGALAEPNSYAYGINDAATIVGESATDVQSPPGFVVNHAFLWQEGEGMSDLDPNPTSRSAAYAVSDGGKVAGYQSNRAFLWDETDGPVPLPGAHGTAYALNEVGQVAGESFVLVAPLVQFPHAILWQEPTIPDPPRDAVAVPRDQAATVRWSAPSSNGGLPIFLYEVTATPGGQTCQTSGYPELECTVGGLQNGVEYTFTVTARNDIGESGPSDPSAPVTPDCEGFTGVTPARVLDTRSGPVPPGYPSGQPLSGPGSIDLDVTGVGSVPDDATAVVLNVTSVSATTNLAYVTVWPTGDPRPTASNLNVNPGQNLPNLVTVKVGLGGKVSLYTNTGQVHLVADAVGYYAAGEGDSFEGVTPARVLDTRSGPVPPGYPAGQRLSGPGSIDLDVTGVGGVPDDATAVVLNVTSVSATTNLAYVTVWPTGVARPLASNLNVNPGQNLPNLVIVKVGQGGKVSLYTNTGQVHLVADVVGYFGPSGTGCFVGVTPKRLLDTRSTPVPPGYPSGQPLAGPGTIELDVRSPGVVPDGATGVVLNVTSVSATTNLAFVTVWPTGWRVPWRRT